MKQILSILLTVVLVGTVAVAPVGAEGLIASDGTKTAYIFASVADAAQVDSITGLTSSAAEPGAELNAGRTSTILPVQDAPVYGSGNTNVTLNGMSSIVIPKKYTLPINHDNEQFDVYVDSQGAVYWYYTGTDVLHSFEPYTENLELGDTIVDGEAAKTAADVFLESTDYDVTGYTVITSNEYSKNYTIRYQSPVKEDCYLTFNLQADTDGTVYIVKVTVQN